MNESQYQERLIEFQNKFHIWDQGYVFNGIHHLMYDENLTDSQKVEMVKRVLEAYEEAQV